MDPTNNHGLTPKPPGMFFQDIPENLYPNQKVPEEAPRRFVDVDIFHDITLSDLMVTVLYEYDERVLKAFLNPDFEDIAFYRWANKSDDEDFSNDESDNKDFFIQKEGPIIRCGWIVRSEFNKPLYNRVFLYTIEKFGEWKPTSCVFWGLYWPVELHHPRTVSEQGKVFAKLGLVEQWWLEQKDEQIQLVGIDLSEPGQVRYKRDQKTWLKIFDG